MPPCGDRCLAITLPEPPPAHQSIANPLPPEAQPHRSTTQLAHAVAELSQSPPSRRSPLQRNVSATPRQSLALPQQACTPQSIAIAVPPNAPSGRGPCYALPAKPLPDQATRTGAPASLTIATPLPRLPLPALPLALPSRHFALATPRQDSPCSRHGVSPPAHAVPLHRSPSPACPRCGIPALYIPWPVPRLADPTLAVPAAGLALLPPGVAFRGIPELGLGNAWQSRSRGWTWPGSAAPLRSRPSRLPAWRASPSGGFALHSPRSAMLCCHRAGRWSAPLVPRWRSRRMVASRPA